MSDIAVIETGGKQYKVAVGDTISIEKLSGEYKEGDKVTFDSVLMCGSDKDTKIGTPVLKGVNVIGTLKEIGRKKKVNVVHYKSKSNHYKKYGHRQPFFKVEIKSIK